MIIKKKLVRNSWQEYYFYFQNRNWKVSKRDWNAVGVKLARDIFWRSHRKEKFKAVQKEMAKAHFYTWYRSVYGML